MAKYDEQLQRMMHLMNYDNTLNESKKTNNGIECHRTAADGKEYGIIKEGAYYYIKTTTPDKMNMVESYDYLNGFNRRNETRYNSYNSATKQLELHLMSINEAYNKHEDVTVANVNSSKEAFSILTEDARKELDRMHMIFENSFISKDNIGNHGDPESKGSSTGANTTKNNTPFEEKAEAKLDKVMDKKGSVKDATSDYSKVSDGDSKLQHADKMERGKRGDEEYKDTHDDLEGEGVADKKPKGAKSVKMNESSVYDDLDANVDGEVGADRYEEEQGLLGDKDIFGGEDADIFGDGEVVEEPIEGQDADIFGDGVEEPIEGLHTDIEGDEEGIVGLGKDSIEESLDELLREFLDGESGVQEPTGTEAPATPAAPATIEEEEKIVGPDPVLDGPHGKGNSVHGEKTMDRIEETVNRITRMVVESLCKEEDKCECGKKGCKCKDGKCECGKKKPVSLQEKIDKIVKEEVTKLNAWGKHPRYRKQPMTTPANTDVKAGTADKDWCDDSVKGNQAYGQKIGSSAPFETKVDALTEKVFESVKRKLTKSVK